MIGPRPPETETTKPPPGRQHTLRTVGPRAPHWEERALAAIRGWLGRRRAGIGARWADLTVDVGNVSAGIILSSWPWFWAAIWVWDMPASGKLAWTGGSLIAGGALWWVYGLWLASREPKE